MIRIEKPVEPPEVLRTKGRNKRKGHCSAYTRDPEAYRTGAKKFKFADYYSHETVRAALQKAQHNKCCYCERRIGREDSDVEHFRPKSAVRQRLGDPRKRPGYYWLAYEWNNLYLSCIACNQRCKSDLFPLQDPSTRARSHHDDLGREQPVLVDPGVDDPAKHIGFRGEIAHPIVGSKKGKRTIEMLKLNRSSLQEARRDRLQLLKSLSQVVLLSENRPSDYQLRAEAVKATRLLQKAIRDEAEFAAAVRAAFL